MHIATNTGRVLKNVLPAPLYKLVYAVWLALLSFPFNVKRLASLYGSNCFCPICNRSFKNFLPYKNKCAIAEKADIISGKSIASMHCPYCLSSNRERNLYLFLKQRASLFLRKKILHFAPEKNLYFFLKNTDCAEYICADLEPKQYTFAADIQKNDLTQLSYNDASFDLVICNHVLEHIPNDGLAMREIFRVLKQAGIAILLVPIGAKLTQTFEDPTKITNLERAEAFGQFDHLRIYTEADYIRRLEAAGFSIEIIQLRLTEEEITKYGIDPREKLYVAHKS